MWSPTAANIIIEKVWYGTNHGLYRHLQTVKTTAGCCIISRQLQIIADSCRYVCSCLFCELWISGGICFSCCISFVYYNTTIFVSWGPAKCGWYCPGKFSFFFKGHFATSDKGKKNPFQSIGIISSGSVLNIKKICPKVKVQLVLNIVKFHQFRKTCPIFFVKHYCFLIWGIMHYIFFALPLILKYILTLNHKLEKFLWFFWSEW